MTTTPFADRPMHPREGLFLVLTGVFITALTLGNIVGVTKFAQLPWFGLTVPVGLLAYPVTFLATDLIGELYGRRRAQAVVWVGFVMNFFMLGLMWLGNTLPDAAGVTGAGSTFESVYRFMKPNVVASMLAYLVAQSVDVRLFHFWKRLTKGRHLWLRNNGSTMVSQIVDTVIILSILYVTGGLGTDISSIGALVALMFNSYIFKFFFALFDTPLFYLGTHLLQPLVERE